MNQQTIRTNDTPMQEAMTTMGLLCDELVTALKHQEDQQIHRNDAEVMTVALMAASLLHGDVEHARHCLKADGSIKQRRSERRLNRRLHAMPEFVWHTLFQILASTFNMLELNRQLHAAAQKFLRFLDASYHPKNLSAKLDTFYMLAFDEFTAELAKQKVTLSKKEAFELMEFFEEHARRDSSDETDD